MRTGAQQLYLVSEILFGLSGAGIGITVFLGIRFRIWRQIRTDREESQVIGRVYPKKRKGWNLFAKMERRDNEKAEECSPCGMGEEITADLVSGREEEKETEALGAGRGNGKVLAGLRSDKECENETAALGADTWRENETMALELCIADGRQVKEDET